MSATNHGIDRSRAPEPSAPHPYHFPKLERFTLPNGLRVVLAERRGSPLISMRALVRSGADHDPRDYAGLAALTSDMIDEGAGDYDAMALAEAIAGIGAALATGADWDASYVAVDVLKKNLEPAIALMRDVIIRPRLEESELLRLRSEVVTAIVQQKDDPGSVAGKSFARFLYEGTPYENPVIGTVETVSNIDAERLRAFYREQFVASNLSLIIAGGFESDRLRSVIESEFGGASAGKASVPVVVAPRRIEQTRVLLIDRPDSVQSEIRVGHVGVEKTNRDYFALVVMNAILGGVFNSRIMINLRERNGFTYGARSAFAFRRAAGPFVVSTAVRNSVTADAVREIMGEINAIRSTPVGVEELRDAKNYLVGTFPATVQTVGDLATRIQELELYGLPDDYFDGYRARLDAVTAADVQRVANQYLSPSNAAIAVVGKASEVIGPLRALGHPIDVFDVDGQPMEVT